MQEAECLQHQHLAEHNDRKITITGRGEVRNKRNHQLLQEAPLTILGTIGTAITQIVHGATMVPADPVMILHREVEVVVQHAKPLLRVQAQTVERGVGIN